MLRMCDEDDRLELVVADAMVADSSIRMSCGICTVSRWPLLGRCETAWMVGEVDHLLKIFVPKQGKCY